jgi:hypothetical protein
MNVESHSYSLGWALLASYNQTRSLRKKLIEDMYAQQMGQGISIMQCALYQFQDSEQNVLEVSTCNKHLSDGYHNEHPQTE